MTLRERMTRDLRVRGLSPVTQKSYLNSITNLAIFFGKSPEKLTLENILDYQYHLLTERKLGPNTINQINSAIRFLYKVTLDNHIAVEKIPNLKKPKSLPIVLSKEEMFRLIQHTSTILDKALLSTFYATGLRLRELINLKVEDIDSDRMIINVRRGKGGKDRIVQLSSGLLKLLRNYWVTGRPKTESPYLFPGRGKSGQLPRKTISDMLHTCVKHAKIRKKVTPHTLRHSFATHLLENGTNIVCIQALLGHSSITTTMIYLHLRNDFINQIDSPLDALFPAADYTGGDR